MLFYQPADGYCFNSDSIFLYDFAASFALRGPLLDVGSGVGVIGLLLARDFNLPVTLVEKQAKMAYLARINARVNRIEARVVEQDFLTFKSPGQFETIVSNPPFYHPDVIQSKDAHLNACRYNTHLPILPFFQKIKRLIAPRGRFIFCYDPTQLSALLTGLEAVGLRAENICMVHPKADRPAKLVMIHARNQSKARSTIEPPFVVFEGQEYGRRAQAIFKKARTHTIKCEIS